MKINELLNVVDEGWVRKPNGFRVRFQTAAKDGWVTDTMPGEAQGLLDSDVVAWRSAWKLWQAARSGAGEYVNITVIDDRGEPVPSYITGRCDVYNPREDVLSAPAAGAAADAGDDGTADVQPGSEEDTDDRQGSDPAER
jgi:hypothetical protein